MALHLPGGWDETTRGTGTGGVQDLGYRNVPVGLKTTVQTPNTSATVTLTCEPGECRHLHPPTYMQECLCPVSIDMFLIHTDMFFMI